MNASPNTTNVDEKKTKRKHAKTVSSCIRLISGDTNTGALFLRQCYFVLV